MDPVIYLGFLVLELIFLISVTIYLVFLIYSSIMGAPYVPSRTKLVRDLLSHIKPNNKTNILELGCGDGSFNRIAAQKYKARGLGVDINSIVLLKARLLAHIQKLPHVSFERRNIFKQSLEGYNLIYLFLMPKLLAKLAPQFKKELKPSTLVVSHGFKIPTCDKYITQVIQGKPFDSYFYRFPKTKSRLS